MKISRTLAAMAVAARAKWSEEKVIRAHAGAVYHVAAVGFSPGFPYLLGLPARLATPRSFPWSLVRKLTTRSASFSG